MAFEGLEFASGVGVPHPDRLVAGPGEGSPSVRAPRHTVHRIGVAFEGSEFAASLGVPHADRPVVGSGEGPPSVRAPRHTVDRAGVSFEGPEFASSLGVPHPDRLVAGPGEGPPSVRAPRDIFDPVLVASEDQSLVLIGGVSQIRCLRLGDHVEAEEVGDGLVPVRPPVEIKELRERAGRLGVVEAERDEPAFPVERVPEPERVALQPRPVGAEGVLRHAEHEHAGALQPLLDLGRDAVARPDGPLVKPHVDAVGAEALGDVAYGVLVLRTVAEEDVVLEGVGHRASAGCARGRRKGSRLGWRRSVQARRRPRLSRDLSSPSS